MFDELATQSADYQAPQITPPAFNNRYQELEDIVAIVLDIQQRTYNPIESVVAQYQGQLRLDSAEAYEIVDHRLEPMGYHAHFSIDETTNLHRIDIFRGRFSPPPRPVWPNVVLLFLTILSTMSVGALLEDVPYEKLFSLESLKGWPYALSVMLILGAHELGHYFAARHHKVSVTLPYFLPFPPVLGFGFGTFGAFIQLREPMRNRKQLFDVGVAGPLAGLIFAIPILIAGIATAEINHLPTTEDCREDGICDYLLEGNSIVYAVAKYVIHGKWLPNDIEDMTINQLSFAGWTGLFVTGLNLLPVGQLDGGHILYTLVGRTARRLYVPAMIVMGLLALNNSSWLLWVMLLFFFGRIHAVPMDDITPLDSRRRTLGIIALVVFFLIFTPSPFEIISVR